MKVLLTGFSAFGKVRVNPSEQIVRLFAARPAVGAARRVALSRNPPLQLATAVLPVEYAAAARTIRRLIRAERPDAVLCLGVAPGRPAICLERVARNLDDSRQRDNRGELRQDRRIVRGAPAIYRSTLPLEAIQKALRRRGLAAKLSDDAGGFLCNHVFYVARHEAARLRRAMPCGFIHVPSLPRAGRKRESGVTFDQMRQAVECCLAAIVREAGKLPRRASAPLPHGRGSETAA